MHGLYADKANKFCTPAGHNFSQLVAGCQGEAKLAAVEPDAHGVEWFSTTNPDGLVSMRKSPLPRSLTNVKRGFFEQKREDARGWARKQLARTRNRKYRPNENQKPDPTVAKANKSLASRFYQMKTGHCLTGQYLAWTTRRPGARAGGASTASRPGSTSSSTAPNGEASRRPSGRPSWKRQESFPAPPEAETVPASRSCSPTSGAVRRCSSFSLR